MRVTYCTKAVQKPSVCFFLYWKFLKVSGSFCTVVKTRAGTSNISANWKCIHFFWEALRSDHTAVAQCPPPSNLMLSTPSRSLGFGSDWCFPGWALWKAPSTLIPCSVLWDLCWFLNSYLFLSGGQILLQPGQDELLPTLWLKSFLKGSWIRSRATVKASLQPWGSKGKSIKPQLDV